MSARFLHLLFLNLCAINLIQAQETPRFKAINKAFITPDSKVIMIVSHRGTHNDDPENSMAAFRKSIALGIDVIELDVRHTKDDSLVVMHDATVDRTTDGKGAVADLTFAEIRKFRLKHKGMLTNEIVPTLQEALNLTNGKIMVDLDIKTNRVMQITEVVDRTNTTNTAFFFLGKGAYAKMLKEKNVNYKTLVRSHSAADVDSIFAVTKSEAIHIDPSHYTPAVSSKIKKEGARVWINALGEVDKRAAAGDLEAFGMLLKNGANMIQTDYPALLMKYLKSKNLYY